MGYMETLKKRRSVYGLSSDMKTGNEEIVSMVYRIIEETPSAFNIQSSRAVILFGGEHRRLWAITADMPNLRTPLACSPPIPLACFK